jgi:hypothetical protein
VAQVNPTQRLVLIAARLAPRTRGESGVFWLGVVVGLVIAVLGFLVRGEW